MLLVVSSASATECKIKQDILKADYTFAQTDQQNHSKSYGFTLWRNGKTVAHENKLTHITDMWHKTSADTLALVRYFDQDKRGIEYQPNDVKYTNKDNHWQNNYQLISDSELKSMTLEKTTGEACEKVETYSSVKNGQKLTIDWLPEQKLIKHYQANHGNITETWQLTSVESSPAIVNQAFHSRDEYKTTDYIDIGDMESDPFLIKMINLGQISHSESGFYDANGNPMNGGGHRH